MTTEKLPEYINCDRKGIVHCDYLLTVLCPSTCGYALDIGGVDVPPRNETEKDLSDITKT